jgi:quercetin dioxygenase-like cupin family protein
MNLGGAAFIALIVGCSDGDSGRITAQNPPTPSAAPSSSVAAGNVHVGVRDKDLNWGPAPAIFPKGALFAVVQGDPSVAGEIFTVRLLFPNGYVLPPHIHPAEEHVTVLSGTFLAGMGEDFSVRALIPFKVGDFMTMPKNAPHFAKARGITEVQVHGIGPFALTYVHPEDDPTK